MMGGKGNGYGTIIMLCIFVGLPIMILVEYGWLIVILIGIVVAVLIIAALSSDSTREKQMENITHVDLIRRTNIYKEGFEHTGFSIGTSGHGRAYFGKRKRLQGVEAVFYVTYSDKPSQQITAMEGSDQYSQLMSYIQIQDKVERNRHMNEQEKKDTEELENRKKEEARLLLALNKKADEKKRLPKSKYLEIPFEVLPNEFSVEVKHKTCYYKFTDNDGGRYEVDIRCEIYYDPSVKGVTNRMIIIALYDADGHIIDTRNTWSKPLDKSGCKVVEFNFWRNIETEPSKVSISVERCN